MIRAFTTYLFFHIFLLVISPTGYSQSTFNIIREEIMIPTSDNVSLGAILYRPETAGKWPAIVYRTPYGIDDYDSYAEFPRKAAQRGYLVFLIDVRGRYRSEGVFEAYRNEKRDGYDVLEWISGHPNCNGKVGTYGGSYPGIVQWQAMSMSPPHLIAAAPEMTPISSHHFFYNGGAFSMPWLDWFVPYIFPDKRKKANDHSGTWDDETGSLEWRESDRKQWYQYRPLNEIPILKEYAPEFFDWLEHPDSSSWWDFVNIKEDFSDFIVPVYLLSGWYDSAYGVEGAWQAFDKIHKEEISDHVKKHSKLILGPWNHTSITTRKTKFGNIDFGPAAGLDYDALLLTWYDMVLKNLSPVISQEMVNIFVMGANRWRSFKKWPIEPIEEETFYLNGDFSLSNSAEQVATSASYTFNPKNTLWDKSYEKSYPYDQRVNEERQDVLVFSTPTLTEDTEVIGEIKAKLFVSSSARDTDFAITLSDVYPDGRSINLSGMDAGYLRMRYREDNGYQMLMESDKIYEIEIGKLYTANVFKKGHKIRLTITSSKTPHYDPNPNTGNEIASDTKLQSCINYIHFGGNTNSRILLPRFKGN